MAVCLFDRLCLSEPAFAVPRVPTHTMQHWSQGSLSAERRSRERSQAQGACSRFALVRAGFARLLDNASSTSVVFTMVPVVHQLAVMEKHCKGSTSRCTCIHSQLERTIAAHTVTWARRRQVKSMTSCLTGAAAAALRKEDELEDEAPLDEPNPLDDDEDHAEALDFAAPPRCRSNSSSLSASDLVSHLTDASVLTRFWWRLSRSCAKWSAAWSADLQTHMA
jgi:hypothetical protein